MTETVDAVMFFSLWTAVFVLAAFLRDLQKRHNEVSTRLGNLEDILGEGEECETGDYAS